MSVIFIVFERYIRESYVIILYYTIMFSKTRYSPTALSDALAEAFPLAIHLRCFRYFRGNFQSRLKNLAITETRSYYEEVFGKQEGTVYQEGLLDATSEDEFDARLLSLRESWVKREQCEEENCKVYQWMEERSLMIKSNMLAS